MGNERKRTHDAVAESGKWIIIGLLPVRVRPLTLGQIWELGHYTEQLDADGLEDRKLRLYAEVFARYDNARLMQDIFITAAFRTKLTRFLLGWYIRKNLTFNTYSTLIDYDLEGLDANFFLTSIISLKRTTKMTEPKIMTVRGRQSEE